MNKKHAYNHPNDGCMRVSHVVPVANSNILKLVSILSPRYPARFPENNKKKSVCLLERRNLPNPALGDKPF